MPKGRYQHGTERPAGPPPPHWLGSSPPPPWPGQPPAPQYPPAPAWASTSEPAVWPAAPADLAHPYAPPPGAGRGPSGALILVGIALGVALSVLVLVGLYHLFVNSMPPLRPPDSAILDDPEVVAAVMTACADLTDALEEIPYGETAASARSVWLRAENDAIGDFLARVRRVGTNRLADDEPATRWLADWERLRDARAAYADKIDRGARLGFEPPRGVDGRPLPAAMDLVGYGCAVPPRLYEIGNAATPPAM